MKKSERSKIREPKLSELIPSSSSDACDRMEGLLFRGETLSFSESGWTAEGCRFEECRFSFCPQAQIMDAVFDRCDLSNADFSGSTFIRVKFHHCRMTGCDFSRSCFKDVQCEDCAAVLSNWNASAFCRVSFANTLLPEASFHEGKQEYLSLEDCDLKEAEFFHFSLAGVDLSGCEIDGIVTDPESLKGLSVSCDQAASLIRLFGIHIRE